MYSVVEAVDVVRVLVHQKPVVLQPISPEEDLADVDAKEEDQDVNGVALVAPQVVDVPQAMVVRDHWILDNTALIVEESNNPSEH